MVIYTTEKRVREIGIRKVIGASVKDIVNELSSSFIKLLMIAALIAIPIGYISGIFLMSVFTFHDGVSIWMMTIVVVAIFSIALATIVINAARAANNNLVHSLRAE